MEVKGQSLKYMMSGWGCFCTNNIMLLCMLRAWLRAVSKQHLWQEKSRMAAEIDDFLFAAPKPNRIAFGSCTERRMFPVYTTPTRFGIEQGLRGEPHRGPGCYDPDPVSLFLQPLDSQPQSRKGWYFGATLAARLPKMREGIKPGPADYQKVKSSPPKQRYKPFGSSAPRLPEEDPESKKPPGPGAYEHDVRQNRRIEFAEAFGGKKTLCATVTIKCTKGVPDICDGCGQEPRGDYYDNSKKPLCRSCYEQRLSHDSLGEGLPGYRKVRDCRSVHRHEFPGKEPKIIIMTEKQQHKLRYKEAYLKQYYS